MMPGTGYVLKEAVLVNCRNYCFLTFQQLEEAGIPHFTTAGREDTVPLGGGQGQGL